jgi:transposase
MSSTKEKAAREYNREHEAYSSYKSWTISDSFWEAVKEYIPEHEREPEKEYRRKPGGGRKPPDKRVILEGILYVLRTGVQWKAAPKEYGSGSNLHRYFQLWLASGFFLKIWQAGLEKYDEIAGIGWEWQSVDGSQSKAPQSGSESVGANPTDRGKKWSEKKSAGR